MQMGRLVGVTTMKALPLAYNKDMQEDKSHSSMDELSICLRVLTPLLEGLSVRRAEARTAATGDFANATELADHLTGGRSLPRGSPPGRKTGRGRHRAGHHPGGSPARSHPSTRPRSDRDGVRRSHHRRRPGSSRFDGRHGSRTGRRATRPTRHAATKDLDSPETIHVRTATVEDLPGIKRLVDLWADAGENLPRTDEEILHSISDFAVALHEGRVVGCGALWLYAPDLAEIRSVGVDPDLHGGGVGSRVVEHLATIAHDLRVERVFVLTRAPLFFERLGFTQVSVNGLPEKILKDCACPKKDCCDEIAMARTTWKA